MTGNDNDFDVDAAIARNRLLKAAIIMTQNLSYSLPMTDPPSAVPSHVANRERVLHYLIWGDDVNDTRFHHKHDVRPVAARRCASCGHADNYHGRPWNGADVCLASLCHCKVFVPQDATS